MAFFYGNFTAKKFGRLGLVPDLATGALLADHT
jgi:hypothetical protein